MIRPTSRTQAHVLRVIGVSATDHSDTLAPSSNDGPDVFLAAPGVDLLTTAPGGGSTSISGTSASSAIMGVGTITDDAHAGHRLRRAHSLRLVDRSDHPPGDPATKEIAPIGTARCVPRTNISPARPGRSRHRPGRRDAPIRPAIAAMTAITPTIATARNRAAPLPPPRTAPGTTLADGVATTADVGDATDGTADGATGLKSGGSVPGGGVISAYRPTPSRARPGRGPCPAGPGPRGRRRASLRAARTHGRSSRRGRSARYRAADSARRCSGVWVVWLVHVTGSPTTTVSSAGTSPASVIAIACSSARTTAAGQRRGTGSRRRAGTMPAARPRTEHASPPPRTRAHRAECSVGIRGRDRPPYP